MKRYIVEVRGKIEVEAESKADALNLATWEFDSSNIESVDVICSEYIMENDLYD